MKCTWIKPGGGQCGQETGKPCPPMWVKHAQFTPIALHIFFDGIPGEEFLLELKAFVCPDHMSDYVAYLKRSAVGKRGAKTRKMRKTEDYSI